MKRVDINPNTLLISVMDVVDMIEKDIVEHAAEVYARQEYYTHKYRGDLLNDVNVGIYLDDDLRFAVQVYASNGQSAMRTKLKLSQNLQRISAQTIMNKKHMIITETLPVYDTIAFNERFAELKSKVVNSNPGFTLDETLIKYPENGQFIVQFNFI